jgi:hypothetical protein
MALDTFSHSSLEPFYLLSNWLTASLAVTGGTRWRVSKKGKIFPLSDPPKENGSDFQMFSRREIPSRSTPRDDILKPDPIIDRPPNIVRLCFSPLFLECSRPTQLMPRARLVYSLDQTRLLRHNLTISTPAISALNAALMAFHKRTPRPSFTSAPINQVHAEITRCLNKLTLENQSLILPIIAAQLNSDGFDFFVSTIVPMAIGQMMFAPLYAQFCAFLCSNLTSGSALRDALKTAVFKEESSPGQGCFLGCLAAQKLVPIKELFLYAQNLMRIKTNSSLEIFYHLSIQSGQLLEAQIPQARSLYDSLRTLPEGIGQRIRFFVQDLLASRSAGWKPVNLLPKGVVKPVEPDPLSEGDRILREFVSEGTICVYWSQRMTRDVMRSLILNTRSNFKKGVQIFGKLKGNRLLTEKVAFVALRETVQTLDDDPQLCREYPHAIHYCGAIFAHLVHHQIVQLALFGSVSALRFDPAFFTGILEEAADLDMFDQVANSPWMKQLRFRPELFSHLHFVDLLGPTGMIECWPIYEAMSEVVSAMEEGIEPSELEHVIADYGVATAKDFIEFAAETIVIFKPTQYIAVLTPIIAKHAKLALSHIERIGEFHKWSHDQTAAQICGLADLLDYDLTEWIKARGLKSHDEVSRAIARM